MFVSWCGDGGIWAQCLFAHWKICKWPDLEKAIVKVLETFDGVENLSAKQRDGNVNFICRHDVLAVLPTGFRKSLLFQLIPGLCVELHNLGYSYYRYAKSPIFYCVCHLRKCPNPMPNEAIGASTNFVHLFIWRRCRPRWCFCWSILFYICKPQGTYSEWKVEEDAPDAGLPKKPLRDCCWWGSCDFEIVPRSIFFIYQLSAGKNR